MKFDIMILVYGKALPVPGGLAGDGENDYVIQLRIQTSWLSL